ncbi:MAG: DUF1294 domain-containing protein [Clostridia bacterium]|nr:DUF1294 domain-containing protein [Clostridia bacterium]
MDGKTWFIIYIAYLFLLSAVTFFMYGADKRKAKRGTRRTPEKTLLLSSFLGGAFGGFAAMQIYRHKTTGEHWYFTAVNLLGIALHTAAAIFIAVSVF